MQRITTATRVPDLFGPGRAGFRNGDLATGLSPTDLNAEWFNGIQEEVLAVIEEAGLVPNAADRSQLLQALNLRAGVPAGSVMAFARTTPPTGWLRANGAAVSRSTYAGLYTAIGTAFGAGDGSTTFNLPDLRGEFIRGLDDGRGVDAGRVLGAAQAALLGSHSHTGTTSATGDHTHPLGIYVTGSGNNGTTAAYSSGSFTPMTSGAGGAHSHTFTTDSSGGAETRPRNQALLFCIKF